MKKLIIPAMAVIGLVGCSEDTKEWSQIDNDPMIQTSIRVAGGKLAHAQFIVNQMGLVSFRLMIPDACDEVTDPISPMPAIVEGTYIKVFEFCDGKNVINFPQTAEGNDFMRQQFTNKTHVKYSQVVFPSKGFVPLYNKLVNYKDDMASAL